MKESLFRLQYEVPEVDVYTEKGSAAGAKLTLDDIADPYVREVMGMVSKMSYKQILKWLSEQGQNEKLAVIPFTTHTPEALNYRLEERHPQLLFLMRPLHTIYKLDAFLEAANRNLPVGATVWCHSMTSVLRRQLTKSKYPWGLSHLVILFNYLWHRVCPKLNLTRKFYYNITKGKSRSMSRVEVLGRLYRAGFEVVDEQFRNGEFVVVASKVKEPIGDIPPNGSPIIHLRRIGLDGREIVVHKFRTMFVYSEYMQSYVYHYQNLERGGKFKDDYRVTPMGRFLRRTWLDELPMVWNMLRGDLKLVGVRPLSRQYFELYTPEMQALRTRSKPGLLPPFYYDEHTPETIDDVQASERRYLEAYLEHPFKTDWRYFWGIVGNILFHKKHSA